MRRTALEVGIVVRVKRVERKARIRRLGRSAREDALAPDDGVDAFPALTLRGSCSHVQLLLMHLKPPSSLYSSSRRPLHDDAPRQARVLDRLAVVRQVTRRESRLQDVGGVGLARARAAERMRASVLHQGLRKEQERTR